MVSSVTRRRLLTVTVGGLTALTGCQSLSGLNSRIPVQIHILNTTNENIEAWIQLTDIDTGNDQAGESVLVDPGMVQKLGMKVPKATYQLRVATDDMTPALEQTVQWKITGQDCAKNSYATFVSSEMEIDLQLLAQNCDHT